jgi:hypothetical protein
MSRFSCVLAVTALLSGSAACSGESSDEPSETVPLPPPRELGGGDAARIVVVAGSEIGLRRPRDLDFDPRRPGDLWVVNDGDNSVVILHGIGTAQVSAERRRDVAANHFMDHPSSIAFGADETSFGIPGTFATCGESRNGHAHEVALDFMGPVLWSSDPSIFARKNPEGLGSHLDMLHVSPLCMGIAHERDNVYWAVSGLTGAIVRYDFGVDHDVGQDDHSDGAAWEYVEGRIDYQPGVPAHLAWDASTSSVWVADPAGGRVARLDATSAKVGAALRAMEPMREYVRMDGAELVDVVPASSGSLVTPSGIALRGELVYVSDDATSRIIAFTRKGEPVASLDTGLPAGSLAGIAFAPDGKLWFVDMAGSRVLYVDPL